MDGEVPDGAVGAVGHVRTAPGTPAVERTANDTSRAGREITVAQQDLFGPATRLNQCTAIRPRHRLANLQRPPSCAIVLAEVKIVVRRGQQAVGPSSLSGQNYQGVDVARAESATDRLPGAAAIAALMDAIDLDTGP